MGECLVISSMFGLCVEEQEWERKRSELDLVSEEIYSTQVELIA